MTIRDVVFIAIGEIVLVGTFVTGLLVGLALSHRKESDHDYGNEGTEGPQIQSRYPRRNADGN